MTTFNLYKYNVVVRWKYDNEYETIVLHSIQEYKSIDGSRLLNHRRWNFGQPSNTENLETVEHSENVYYFTHYDL